MADAILSHNAGAEFTDLSNLFSPSRQDRRFKQILALLVGVYLIFAIGIPFLEQAQLPREIKEQLPPQLAKIILKEKLLPVPEKPTELRPPEPVIEAEAEPENKPKVKEPPVEIEKPVTPPKATREAAREKARNSGLAAMKDELFSMREAFDIKPAVQTRLRQEQSQEVKVKRNLISAAANRQSQGISAPTVSRTLTSDSLSTKGTQRVRLAAEEVLASEGAAAQRQSQTSDSGQRSEAAIRRTLEANKARLYALYNRALRKDPFLSGKVLFDITIQPGGDVSRVAIKSSELNNKKLERQLTLVLRSIQFPKEAVVTMTTIWAIDFLPG